MLMYAMHICWAMWGGMCSTPERVSAPVSVERCYADLARIRNLQETDKAWCAPIWIKK